MRAMLIKILSICGVAFLCAGCSSISPISVLPGAEHQVGQYPNINTHPSNPTRAPIPEAQVEVVKAGLQAKARNRALR